ncbi:putative thymidylate kinase [Jimgerdemannia flammicorona]|uniref:Thymidylate kinase n=1 Tax=Jimgerdemannia flammicorona TaxID=994334 RepID=A0A433ATV5_9FUNG|nr:putative thymidylate kinase [Jimgerdemannia flammicorona]
MLNRILNNLGRGALIVIEGCDRAGKSTQCMKLVDRLEDQGIKARLLKFPGMFRSPSGSRIGQHPDMSFAYQPDRSTSIGQMINAYLTNAKDIEDHAIHLLFSANRWEAMTHLKSLLIAGTTVIIDRYAYSGVAFSAAKGLDLKWCKQPDVGLVTPDLVLFLDLPVEEAEKRGGFGGERYETKAFQKKVRDIFMDLRDRSWKILDARVSIDELHARVLEEVMRTIENSKALQIREDLWKW